MHNKNSTIYPICAPINNSLRTINFYLLENKNNLTLIDAGLDNKENWDSFLTVLKENDFLIGDITEIILTHHHEDHVGLVNKILEQKKVPVYSHEKSIPHLKKDRQLLLERIAFFEKIFQEMNSGRLGKKVIELLEKNVEKEIETAINTEIIPFQLDEKILGHTIIEVPGHAPDQVVLLDEERKYLFGADQAIEHRNVVALPEPTVEGEREPVLEQYIQSLNKCLNLDVDTIYSGHGDVINEPKKVLNRKLADIEVQANKVLQIVKDGFSTGSEIAIEYFSFEKYKSNFFVVMSDIVSYLDLLESRNEVKKKFSEGVWHYRAE